MASFLPRGARARGRLLPARRQSRFLLLPLASVLLPLMVVCVGGWVLWRITWQNADTQLARRADVAAEYSSRVMGGNVLAAGRINDAIQGLSDAEIRADEAELHQRLFRLIRELPQAQVAYVIDRQGYPLVAADVFPVPRGVPVAADRDYFRIWAEASTSEKQGPEAGFHVSRVHVGRIDGKSFFVISRPRSGAANGLKPTEFAGVVAVAISPARFAAGLHGLLDRDDDEVMLIRADGQMLVRSSGPDGPLPPIEADSEFYNIVASPGGAGRFSEKTPESDRARLVAVRRVEGYPVFVEATRSYAAIAEGWRNQMAIYLVFGVPATLALLTLSLRVRHSQLRMEAENEGLERALDESDARLRRAQAAGGVLSFAVGPDGMILCDDECRAAWGIAPQTPLHVETLMRMVHPDDRLEFFAVHRRLSQEGGSFNIELRVQPDGGAERWLMVLGEAVAGVAGAPSRIVGVTMDITQRKRIEAAVREREARLRDLVETLDLATVMVRDFDGTISFWSEGCVRLFGWTVAEAVGRTTHDLLHTATPVPSEQIETQLQATGEWNGDLRQRRRDGSEIIVATRKVLRRDGTGRAVAIMATLADVTALRRASTELEQLNQGLESAVREEVEKREAAQQRAAHAERIQALGQLAGGIAHDLNNVLQAVTSGASLAIRDAENPERVRRLARLLTEAAERGAAVTRRLLSFSRRADLRAEPIAPRALLTDLSEVLAHTLGGHVQCEIDAEEGLPCLFADRGQLETALVNLATNARDAMPDGGTVVLSAALDIVVDPITHPAALAPGRYVRLAVMDHGTGMDAGTLARVPEPFFTTKLAGRGTGLGLAMVSGFVRQSGGALWIESAPGQGTTVSLWLPEAMKQAPRLADAARDDAESRDPTRAARVLLVDDDTMVRDVLVQQLQAAGYETSIAPGGPQALALLDDGLELDVMICDLSMRGMSGLAVIREAQARRPGLPAVLLTGYVGDQAALPAEGANFALLRKPVSITELADVIAILLSGETAFVR